MMNQPILISGASSGIGKACALLLSRKGFDVFAGVRKSADGEALKQEATGKLTPVFLDVTDMSSIAACVEKVSGQTGHKLYGLINNAGMSFGGPLECLSMSEIKKMLDVNVVGVFALTKAFLPLLRNNKEGRIINISSISGLFALPGLSCYAASKHAVEALSDALRLEVKPFNVRVSVIEPGSVETPIFEKSKSFSHAMKKGTDQQILELYAPLVNAFDRIAADPQGMPVQHMAHVVVKALCAKKPRTRYLMGKDARLFRRIGRFPDSLRDWLTMLILRKKAA